jgi:hypothetical protein
MTKQANKSNFVAVGACGLAAVLLSSCKMPPREAWHQIQTQGLVRYLGAEPMNRHLASDSRIEAGSTDYLAGYGWVEGDDLSSAPGAGAGQWDFHVSPEMSPFASTESALYTVRQVPGRKGHVYAPDGSHRVVDVRLYAAGQEVRCPHSGRTFRVPVFADQPMVVADSSRGVERQRLTIEPRKHPLRPQQTVQVRPQPSVKELPKTKPQASPKPQASRPDGLMAKRVSGKPNLVYSPYATRQQIVDVTGLKAGAKARCPYTNRVFVVPAIASVSDSEVAKISRNIDFRVLDKPADGGVVASEEGTKAAVAPTAKWSDRKGYITSPFGGQLVDVSGKAAGSIVRCPFSGKLFRVPKGSN